MDSFVCCKQTLLDLNANGHFHSGSQSTPELAGYDYLVNKNNGHIISGIQPITALKSITFNVNYNPNIPGWDVVSVVVEDALGAITTY